MKSATSIWIWSILVSPAFIFSSCKQTPETKEPWAVIINFFSPDSTYYPPTKIFPFPDSLQYTSLESFFTYKDSVPIIGDSTIVYYDNYRANGQKKCCIKDTLPIYIDSINGKKYLFAIGDYITVLQSGHNLDSNLHTRKKLLSAPLVGVELNIPYPAENFKDEYEKLGARYVKIRENFDEVSRQKWNDLVLVETIQFSNTTDRIITSVYKDMNPQEVDSMINILRNFYPAITYQEAVQPDSEGRPSRLIRMQFQGMAVSFTQTSDTEYSCTVTDYYETIKLILRNAGTGYVFRDDVRVY